VIGLNDSARDNGRAFVARHLETPCGKEKLYRSRAIESTHRMSNHAKIGAQPERAARPGRFSAHPRLLQVDIIYQFTEVAMKVSSGCRIRV
jgi:hypothetical protein